VQTVPQRNQVSVGEWLEIVSIGVQSGSIGVNNVVKIPNDDRHDVWNLECLIIYEKHYP
jgi:hypothetical protein